MLVCLAVWMSFAAHSMYGKVMVTYHRSRLFAAVGFEQPVANMYVVPVAMLDGIVGCDFSGFLLILAVVTIGNVLGGGLFVAATYWLVLGEPRK